MLNGMKAAREIGAKVVGITGAKSDLMCGLSDVCVKVPSTSTPRIQEVHEVVYHVVSELVEAELAQGARG
ncbi:hypothetical protein [Sulfodiicoccus acidiphilus]|uniref:hypothetical protein n=1 Tax=Sulfodiicoccus acidiphilus TaxID=1670455 RepID=UPI000F82A7B3|nr:hypothetical protein [Sulfodiicoccus acidiphilus]